MCIKSAFPQRKDYYILITISCQPLFYTLPQIIHVILFLPSSPVLFALQASSLLAFAYLSLIRNALIPRQLYHTRSHHARTRAHMPESLRFSASGTWPWGSSCSFSLMAHNSPSLSPLKIPLVIVDPAIVINRYDHIGRLPSLLAGIGQASRI